MISHFKTNSRDWCKQ